MKVGHLPARGFSLLEVMVALAILSVGLVTLVQVQARSAELAIQARELTVATMLARGKLYDCETDLAKRDALLREGLKLTADNAYYIPIHHQVRPWAMKKNVSTVHRSDDRPEARFTNVGGS